MCYDYKWVSFVRVTLCGCYMCVYISESVFVVPGENVTRFYQMRMMWTH